MTRRETIELLDTIGQRDKATLLQSLASAREATAAAEAVAVAAREQVRVLESKLAEEARQENRRADEGTATVADLHRAETHAALAAERLRERRARVVEDDAQLEAAHAAERALEDALAQAQSAESARKSSKERLLRESIREAHDVEDEAVAEARPPRIDGR